MVWSPDPAQGLERADSIREVLELAAYFLFAEIIGGVLESGEA
jgi:hypothetical protein